MTNEELLAAMMLGWIGFNTLPLARVLEWLASLMWCWTAFT